MEREGSGQNSLLPLPVRQGSVPAGEVGSRQQASFSGFVFSLDCQWLSFLCYWAPGLFPWFVPLVLPRLTWGSRWHVGNVEPSQPQSIRSLSSHIASGH